MTTFKRLLLNLLLLTAVATIYTSCEVEDGIDGIDGADGVNGQDGADGEDGEDFTPEPEMFSDKSNLKALVAMKPQFNYVNAYSILSSSDTLSNDFKLVGAQDGAGFLKDPDSDGYIYIVNAEDTYAVSRIMLDKNLNPISGEWLLNSSVADYARQCSGTMWEAAIHGGSQDLFFLVYVRSGSV